MRYKILTSNREGSFVIREEELEKLYQCLNQGSIGVFMEGWLNPSHFVALVPAKERLEEIRDDKRMGRITEEPSPFAKLMIQNGSIKRLSDKHRTEAQEEVAKGNRKKK